MKLLRAIIVNYEKEFYSLIADTIISDLNEKEKAAWTIIKKNDDLDDAQINRKISQSLFDVEPSNSTYKKWRDVFHKKIQTIVLNHKSKGSDVQKAAFEIDEEIVVIKKIIYMGLRRSIYSDIKKALKKAKKWHQYESARTLYLILIDYYALYGTYDDIEKAKEEYKQTNDVCLEEMRIKELYGKLIKIETLDGDDKALFMDCVGDLKWRLKFDSYIYHTHYFLIRLKIAEDDNQEYERICNEAIHYFENLWFHHKAHLAIFRRRLLERMTLRGEYAKAKLILNALMEEHRKTSYQWHIYALTFLEVLLYSQDYAGAYRLYEEVVNTRTFKNHPKDHREEWYILGMYVYLMNDLESEINMRKIRYNLNDRHADNVKYLVGELFVEMKTGNPDIEKNLKKIKNVHSVDARTLDLCKAIQNGHKYKSTQEVLFGTECIPYETLITKI